MELAPSSADQATQTEVNFNTVLEEIMALFNSYPESESFNVINKLLQTTVLKQKLNITIPDDFLSNSISAMCHLNKCGRYNVIYGVAEGIGTMRPDGCDSLIPAKRMPMGLLE